MQGKAVKVASLAVSALASIALTASLIPTASADDDAQAATYLQMAEMSTGENPDNIVANTYWSHLKKAIVTDAMASDNSKYYILVPESLPAPGETTLAQYDFTDLDGGGNYFNNIGITDGNASLWPMPDFPGMGEQHKYRFGIASYGDEDDGNGNVSARLNPYGFTANDLLSADEISNPTENLNVYSDLEKTGSTDSKAVDDLSAGSDFGLTFTTNFSWFKKFMNGWTLSFFRTGGISDEGIAKEYERFGKIDSQLAFTLNIPDGVTVSEEPKATVEGLDGFTPSVVKSNDGKSLLIRLSLKNPDTTQKWKDLIASIDSMDTSNIRVHVSGLSVSPSATVGDSVSITGEASGYFEFLNSLDDSFTSKAVKGQTSDTNHVYSFFAAKQSDEGRDAGADAAKPNQISYTFNVTEPEPTVVDPWKTEPEASDPADCADNPYVKTATTEGVTYTVTDSKGNALTADSQGRYNYQYGETVTVTATPNDGYAFPEGTTATRTFTAQKAESCNTNNSGNNGNSGTPETPKGDDTTSNNKPAAKPTKKPHAENSLARTGSALAMPVAAGIVLAIAGIALTVVNKKRESADR